MSRTTLRLARLTRQLGRLNGLTPLERPPRLLRTAARRVLLRVYEPADLAELAGAEVSLPDGLRMALDPRSLIEWELLFTGYEPEVRELLRRALRPGSTAIDVGANCGAHTLVMGRACAPGLVVACEPNPVLRERLQANVALNALANVEVVGWAVAGQGGPVALQVPRDPVHTGGASLLPGVHEQLHDAIQVEVEAVTLDQIAERLQLAHVDLVKVDVEGLEAAVLEGGRQLLARDRPVLSFEYTRPWWTAAGRSLEAALAALESLGYDCWMVTWRGLRPIPAGPPERMNLWAVSRGR